MRVIVNYELCEGNSKCVEIAPEVFVVGDDDKARLLDERPGEPMRAKIAEAVHRCPRQALAIEED